MFDTVSLVMTGSVASTEALNRKPYEGCGSEVDLPFGAIEKAKFR